LRENALRFTTTAADAARVRYGEIDADVNWAVITDDGRVLNAFGGIPLKARSAFPSGERLFLLRDDVGSSFRALRTPLRNRTGGVAGTLIVLKDISATRRLVGFIIGGSAGLSLLVLLAAAVIWRAPRRVVLTVAEALAAGETELIEFKEALGRDVLQAT